MTRRVRVLAIAAVVAAAIGGVLILRHANGSSSGDLPAAVTVPTTAPYNARPGPGGSKILTELVDPLTLAVPASWTSPAADAATLPAALDKFAAQAPPLATVLHAEGQLAGKAAVRLFAFKPAAPNAFVSVVSFSTPAAKPLTPAGAAAVVAFAKKRAPHVAVSGVPLPVGLVIKLDTSTVVHNQHVVVEVLVLVAGGRTLYIEMVSETHVAGIPPVFGQIAQSMRLGNG